MTLYCIEYVRTGTSQYVLLIRTYVRKYVPICYVVSQKRHQAGKKTKQQLFLASQNTGTDTPGTYVASRSAVAQEKKKKKSDAIFS